MNLNTQTLRGSVGLPLIVAPMFLVSGTELTIAACKAGVIGSYPVANARSAEDAEQAILDIRHALEQERREHPQRPSAPYAVNLVVHDESKPRFIADFETVQRHKVPLVITSVGDPKNVVAKIHAYGGLVFHDVANLKHARKAIEAGVDGLILLTAGAGGHTGTMNPFAFVEQVRRIWQGVIVLAGGISEGRSIRAAEIMGADYAYMGTRFSATEESLASAEYKALLVSQQAADVMVTECISGFNATFMRGSIIAAGLDPDSLPPRKGLFQPDLPEPIKAWRDVWSAGHGVGSIDDVPAVASLVERLRGEYDQATL
ncbi:NAD(P)H-dependent flavin oxidoreductase [Pseudomonas sp. NFX15]|uniref:NAD(P)H-dependent flavin oxidoreductase n=1 Tax=Pseudomonas sp. NFX15 TaxID=2816958 RepID=UPI003B8C03F8